MLDGCFRTKLTGCTSAIYNDNPFVQINLLIDESKLKKTEWTQYVKEEMLILGGIYELFYTGWAVECRGDTHRPRPDMPNFSALFNHL